MDPQFFSAERRDLVADLETLFESGEITAEQYEASQEFLAELQAPEEWS